MHGGAGSHIGGTSWIADALGSALNVEPASVHVPAPAALFTPASMSSNT
jgi:hypothetical protein